VRRVKFPPSLTESGVGGGRRRKRDPDERVMLLILESLKLVRERWERESKFVSQERLEREVWIVERLPSCGDEKNSLVELMKKNEQETRAQTEFDSNTRRG
jgi:hypothetical protein